MQREAKANPPRLPLVTRLRYAWRLARASPHRPLGRESVLETMGIFRLAAEGIPAEHRALWMIEEGRAALALTALELQSAPFAKRVRLQASLLAQHLRMALLLRAVEQLRLAESGAAGGRG